MQRPFPFSTPSSRRRFVARLFGAGLACGGGTSLYASGWERCRPVLHHNDLPCPGLSAAQTGIRVAHVSDLHLDDWTPAIAIDRAVAMINEAAPDVIVLTGDIITRDPQRLLPTGAALADLRAPLGVFASLGNHDVWHGRQTVITELKRLGIRTLVNESVRLQAPGGPLWLGGLDSIWGGRPDPLATLRHWPEPEPLLLMMHEPDYADQLARLEIPSAQLSGHTHGGQVCAPWGALRTPRFGSKYVSGSHRVGSVNLYVNRGLGTLAVPFRFLCLPEITLHTLSQA